MYAKQKVSISAQNKDLKSKMYELSAKDDGIYQLQPINFNIKRQSQYEKLFMEFFTGQYIGRPLTRAPSLERNRSPPKPKKERGKRNQGQI